LDDPEATQRKFSDGWLKTGDFASRDEEGYLWIKGRTDEFIKTRGFRVSFAEVEARVAAMPGVYECAAAVVSHPEAGEALALFIVGDTAEHALAEKVQHALPSQWTCAAVKVVAELPRTSNGKIARSQLQALI
jgi:acetyl-CoA synthetase